MSCHDIQHQLENDLLDGRTVGAGPATQNHLLSCRKCRNYATTLGRIFQTFQGEKPHTPPPHLLKDIRHFSRARDAKRSQTRRMIISASLAVFLMIGTWQGIKYFDNRSEPIAQKQSSTQTKQTQITVATQNIETSHRSTTAIEIAPIIANLAHSSKSASQSKPTEHVENSTSKNTDFQAEFVIANKNKKIEPSTIILAEEESGEDSGSDNSGDEGSDDGDDDSGDDEESDPMIAETDPAPKLIEPNLQPQIMAVENFGMNPEACPGTATTENSVATNQFDFSMTATSSSESNLNSVPIGDFATGMDFSSSEESNVNFAGNSSAALSQNNSPATHTTGEIEFITGVAPPHENGFTLMPTVGAVSGLGGSTMVFDIRPPPDVVKIIAKLSVAALLTNESLQNHNAHDLLIASAAMDMTLMNQNHHSQASNSSILPTPDLRWVSRAKSLLPNSMCPSSTAPIHEIAISN